MISLSKEPQFSAEDIYEIPAEVGRTYFEFDTGLIEVCRPLFQGYYDSHELLANELARAGVIEASRDWKDVSCKKCRKVHKNSHCGRNAKNHN